MARATLARERLEVAGTLRSALGENLSDVMSLLRAARRGLIEDSTHAQHTLRHAATATREMIAKVRDMTALHRDLDTAPHDPEPVARLAPRLALAGLVISLFALTVTQTIESHDHRPVVLLGGTAISGLLLAQLRWPRYGTRLLLAQAAIALIPLPWLSSSWCAWLTLLATPVLLTQRGFRAGAGVIVLIALRALCTEPQARAGIQAGWIVPALEMTLALVGLAHFWQLSEELNHSRAELIRLTVQMERLRMARDIHDLLGLTLSVLALKSDWAAELAVCDAERAGAEIDESLRIAAEAQRETRAMVSDRVRQSLGDELSSAARVLTDQKIRVALDCDTELPEAAAALLAPVAREAITNILRHSTATQVEIACRQRNGHLRLLIRNDGVADIAPGRTDGQGLRNMRARVLDAGGVFTTATHRREFLLEAAVPVDKHAKCTVETVDDAPLIDDSRTTLGPRSM